MPDVNITSFSDQNDITLVDVVFGGEQSPHDDRLKFSNCKRVIGRNVKVVTRSSRENALDINRGCEDFDMSLDLEGGKQCALVVKGGSQDITLKFLRLVRDPDACYVKVLGIKFHIDVSWDDFSDQSKKPSTGWIIDARPEHERDTPIWYAFGRGTRPKTSGNVKCNWVLSALMHFYNWNKDRRTK